MKAIGNTSIFIGILLISIIHIHPGEQSICCKIIHPGCPIKEKVIWRINQSFPLTPYSVLYTRILSPIKYGIHNRQQTLGPCHIHNNRIHKSRSILITRLQIGILRHVRNCTSRILGYRSRAEQAEQIKMHQRAYTVHLSQNHIFLHLSFTKKARVFRDHLLDNIITIGNYVVSCRPNTSCQTLSRSIFPIERCHFIQTIRQVYPTGGLIIMPDGTGKSPRQILSIQTR